MLGTKQNSQGEYHHQCLERKATERSESGRKAGKREGRHLAG